MVPRPSKELVASRPERASPEELRKLEPNGGWISLEPKHISRIADYIEFLESQLNRTQYLRPGLSSEQQKVLSWELKAWKQNGARAGATKDPRGSTVFAVSTAKLVKLMKDGGGPHMEEDRVAEWRSSELYRNAFRVKKLDLRLRVASRANKREVLALTKLRRQLKENWR
jgi:hypothetical protein